MNTFCKTPLPVPTLSSSCQPVLALPQDAARRVLVIDDTRAIHDDFKKILQSERLPSGLEEAESALFGEPDPLPPKTNFELDSAFQGEEGLELVSRAVTQGRPYQMVFVDVRMPPGLDGIETSCRLWRIDPDLQIVICTAYSDYSWQDMIAKVGHSDRFVILKKPFDTVEVLQLANALTEKWRLLQATRRKMDGLEALVKERTLHLQAANEQLQHEVARRIRREHCLTLQQNITGVLADSTATADDVTTHLLRIACESMDWDVGELWTVDPLSRALRCTSLWHRTSAALAEFKSISQQILLSRGHGLPGIIWETNEPIWVADVAEEKAFCRAGPAAQAGLHGAFAFPVRVRGEFLGVINFLGGQVRQPEEDVVQMFATMGSLIGQSLERRKLEEQLRQSQKMDAIGHLAGGVAHDFNNILTVIQGFAEILKANTGLDPETNEGLGQIAKAANRASNLTRQLLTFSRKHLLHIKPLDLNSVIMQMAKMLHRVIGEDVELQLSYSPSPAGIEADEDTLGQIIMNLSVNARDAMPRGGKLSIGTEFVTIDDSNLKRSPEARKGDFVCLTVSDTGCGISPEILPHIFEPFFTTKDVGRGTGLGLSTVYGIVEQHHGWIEVNSQIGAGSVFRILLPRFISPVPKVELKRPDTPFPGGKEMILLVEDELAVRSLARKILERLGYRILEASSGVDALSVWEKHGEEVNLVLTDMVMPDGLTGRALVEELRGKRPSLKFIYSSGYSPDRAKDNEDLREGVNFLQKPYRTENLARIIRRVLDAQ
jgi:two-component system cell cycle sensor histidine kinase/response regulator CckA